MSRPQQQDRTGGGARAARISGIASGYVILAAAATFLANLVYQALQMRVLDAVVGAMIGVAAVYCLIGILMIVAFGRMGKDAIHQHAAARAEEIIRSRTSLSIGEDAVNA